MLNTFICNSKHLYVAKDEPELISLSQSIAKVAAKLQPAVFILCPGVKHCSP